jgi:hypothetical protein
MGSQNAGMAAALQHLSPILGKSARALARRAIRPIDFI